MRCPFCNAPDTRVVDSRLAGEGDQVRRRRLCTACGERFTTYETAELGLPRVVKRDGRREAFDEAKLRKGLEHALEKRPVQTEAVDAAVERIRRRALRCGERELASQRIGEWAMDALRRLDQVAYVRFASVYRSFEDVQAFRDLVEHLEEEPTPEMRRSQIPLLGDEAGEP